VDECTEDGAAPSIGGKAPGLQVSDPDTGAEAVLRSSFDPHDTLKKVLSS
jgi:hypothetical protein